VVQREADAAFRSLGMMHMLREVMRFRALRLIETSIKWSRMFFALTLIVWACALLGNAGGSPPPPIKEQQKRTASTHQERITNPTDKLNKPVPPLFRPSGYQESNNQKNNANQPWYENPNWAPVVITIVYAIFAGLQWWAIRNQGRAIQQQAIIASRTLTVSQRAWIKTDGSIADATKGALRFEPPGAGIAFTPKMVNVGNLVAQHITFHTWLDIIIPKVGFPSLDQHSAWRAEIQRMKNRQEHFTLFPDEEFPPPGMNFSKWVTVDQQTIDRALVATPSGLHLCIVGCADYTFPSDPGTFYQTWRAYNIGKTKQPVSILPSDKAIHAAALRLEPLGLSGMRDVT
jgi:hypothetical protein